MIHLQWKQGDGGAYNKVVDNMRLQMGHFENSGIIASCCGRGAIFRGHGDKKKVLFGAWNYNKINNGRVEMLEGVDLIIGISKFCTDTYAQYHPRVLPCHLGVNTVQYKPDRWKKGSWCRFLTTCTDDTYGKNIVIEAWKKALPRMDRVDLIVKDHIRGGLSDGEIDKYKNLGKCNVIEPTGWRLTEDQMANLYQESDCLIYPVPSIGSSLTCMEAMACGTPCIIVDYSAPREFIDDTVGYVVPGKITEVKAELKGLYSEKPMWCEADTDKLADMIVHVYENREEARLKGEAARQRMKEGYTWKHVAEKFSELVEENV